MDPIITIDDRPARRPVQCRGREGVSLAARRGARPAARHADPGAVSPGAIARTSSASARPASRRAAWARRRCSWRCAPTARNSRSKRRSRSMRRTDRKLFTVILRDVTERVRAEELLTRSEARLRGILDSAMDAIITVDEKQHIVLFNPAAEAMFGCPRDEAIGAPLDVVHSRALPRRARRPRAQLRRDRHGVAPHGRRARRHRAAPQRRGVPDRRVDLADHASGGRKFYTVILRDVTARDAGGGGAAPVAGGAAGARRGRATTRASRRRAASRASCTTSSARRSTVLQMDVAWCKEKLPAGAARVRAASWTRMAGAARRARSRRRGASPPTCAR